MNDLRDAEDDRLHPVKRYRPIARGELQPERALVLASVLAAGAVAIAAVLGFTSLLLLLAFVALQLAYSLGLKRIIARVREARHIQDLVLGQKGVEVWA